VTLDDSILVRAYVCRAGWVSPAWGCVLSRGGLKAPRMKGDSRMKRVLALVLVVALVSIGLPTASFAGPRVNSSVAGMAKDTTGKPLSNTTVRLRNVITGQLAGTARTSLSGAFTFENLSSGNYIVETVDANGRIMATSSSLDVAPGATIAGVAVTAPAEA
jgi:hypothetical protein